MSKIKWIYNYNNLVDLVTKIKLSLALKIVRNINYITFDMTK